MPHLEPLSFNTTPELAEHFNFFLSTLGFVPNSVLTMQRKPKLVKISKAHSLPMQSVWRLTMLWLLLPNPAR